MQTGAATVQGNEVKFVFVKLSPVNSNIEISTELVPNALPNMLMII